MILFAKEKWPDGVPVPDDTLLVPSAFIGIAKKLYEDEIEELITAEPKFIHGKIMWRQS